LIFDFSPVFLKKIEISGFKSFANKTILDFSDTKKEDFFGITAVVGPNGSGKSNVADAVRWVMGEQSMKNLRGKKMEDIIFAGSGKKARLGSARVTLYLDNQDKKIPLEFSEVTVSRKIYRSGESEFLVNGSKVRLQDIVDILARAGLGKESYAIVNQGMADAVLNATPFERRSIIEDAAGVKHFQIKKDRSIRKLELTRNNLDRVKGLIEEIRPHLKILKRQAEKAAKSKDVALELKKKQNQLFSYLWNNFQLEKNKLNEEKEEIGRVMNNIQREADKISDEIGKQSKENRTSQKLSDLEKEQREQRHKLSSLERELIISEGRIEIEKEKQKSLAIMEEIRVQNIPVDLLYVKENVEEIRKEQENLILKLEKAEKMEDLQDIREYARVIQQRLFDLKLNIEKGKITKEILPANGAKEKEQKNVPDNSKVIQELSKKTTEIRGEIKQIESEIKKAEQEIQEEIETDRKNRQMFFDLERMLRIKQEEVNKHKDRFNDAKIALARIEVREEDLRAEVKDELKITAEDLSAPEGEINQEKIQQEISRLKIQMEQIGGIDPMVLAEYEETKNRFEFLSTESADLERALTGLREVIKEMDHKIKDSFESTFTEINKEFTKYFRIIFGGGNAHLTKLRIQSSRRKNKEEADPENSSPEGEEENETSENEEVREEIGIDIFANPPGKKISNLSMLSGGERALSSLALLFAIISHNPPPFSILDEVEAALDEANSKRFGRILSELSKNSQFVIITHNRETMRQASLLYGITMGEDGISKLLSVRLDQIGQGGQIKA
jgi:chromosome segregation protein